MLDTSHMGCMQAPPMASKEVTRDYSVAAGKMFMPDEASLHDCTTAKALQQHVAVMMSSSQQRRAYVDRSRLRTEVVNLGWVGTRDFLGVHGCPACDSPSPSTKIGRKAACEHYNHARRHIARFSAAQSRPRQRCAFAPKPRDWSEDKGRPTRLPDIGNFSQVQTYHAEGGAYKLRR